MMVLISLCTLYSNVRNTNIHPNKLKVTDNFQILIQFFYEKNIFLVDNQLINEIELFVKSKNLIMDFSSIFQPSTVLSFGILNSNVASLTKVFY